MRVLVGMIGAMLVNFCAAGEPKLQIDAVFPGGNIVVDKIKGADVYVHQDLRDTAGDWFFWYFRARGGQGRTLTFHFTKGNPIGVRGPAVSTDAGKSWRWLGAEAVRGASFQFAVPKDALDVRFRYCERFDLPCRFRENISDARPSCGWPDVTVHEYAC